MPVSKQFVDMTVPNPRPADPASAGLHYALESREGEELFTQTVRNPIRQDIEVFSQDAVRSIHREPLAGATGYFELLLPALKAAHSVAISINPLHPGMLGAPITVRHTLEDIPTLEADDGHQ